VRADVKLKSAVRNATRTDRTAEPERRLMAAVLQGVVDDVRGSIYRRGAGHAPPTTRQLRAAVAYVANTDRQWPFSFENLCEGLNLDPRRLRRALRKQRVQEPVYLAAHDVPNARGMVA
jgi:hypothetical protein